MVATATEYVVQDGGWNTDFSTGLIPEYDFTVVTARFVVDERYQADTVVLAWDGVPHHPDMEEERRILISLGKGWITSDGVHLQRANADDKMQFNAQTKMAHLIDRCVNVFQIADVMKQRGDGTVFDATIWEGLKFRISREVLNATRTDAKETEIPSAFLGVAGAPAATNGNGNGASAGAPVQSLRDQVKAVFASQTDYTAAQTAALSIPGVSNDAALLNEVLAGPTGALFLETRG